MELTSKTRFDYISPLFRGLYLIGLSFVALVLSVVGLWFCGEIFLRIMYFYRDGASLFQSPRERTHGPQILDATLGWKANPEFRFSGERKSKDATFYEASVSFLPNGFRVYGDLVNPAKKRVLVLGDSFTHAIEVSNNKTYYAILGSDTNLEIFGYGVGGYGTLQEFMVLEQLFSKIKPHLIIWQVSSNDLINNHPELEGKSLLNNNRMKRPFLLDGKIEYLTPGHPHDFLFEFGLDSSVFMIFILNRYDRLQAALGGTRSIEYVINESKGNLEPFKQTKTVTTEIFRKAKAVASNTPLLLFLTSSPTERVFIDAWAEIASSTGLRLNTQVIEELERVDGGTGKVYYLDGHWNELGHKIVAETLKPEILKLINDSTLE